MPYLRQQRRIPANGKVAIRMTPAQRDLFTTSRDTPIDLGFSLRKAPVREGELSIRVNRHQLDALIGIAARSRAPDKHAEKKLETFIRYLEKNEDRFADEDDDQGKVEPL